MIEKDVVTRWEWRWVAIVCLVALVVTNVPYLLGWALETPGRVFGGCIMLADDCYSYLAKIRRAAGGEWLFQMPYTPEPHARTLIYTFYLLLGKMVVLVGLSPVAVYHLARVIFGMGLLLTVYRFLAAFTKRLAVRRLAWLMVAFSGGLGWLLVTLGQTDWLGTPPLDFCLPEGFAFLVLYGFPHLAQAQSLLLWGILFLLRAWEVSPMSESPIAPRAPRLTFHAPRITSLKWAALAGLLWLGMGLIVPFYVAIAWAVMGMAWFVLGLRRRQVLFREALMAGVIALISVPVVGYNAWVFTTHPVYVTWGMQNKIFSPHPLHYLAAYGAPLALAAFAVKDTWRDEGPAWLALMWVGIVPVLVYMPFNLQRRLLEGVQVPLSLLAAWGAMQLWHARQRRWAVIALLATMLPTTLINVAGASAWMFMRPALIFRDATEVAALDWLAGQVQPDDVIFTGYETGTYLPVRAMARVFLGHGLETVDADEKVRLVGRFFDIATDDAWRRQLLAEYGVDAVFWGPVERELGGFDPNTAPYLQRVYEAGGYAIFEVEQ